MKEDVICSGHIVYADRFYTSLPVIEYLQSRPIYFTGTIRADRVGLPVALKTSVLKHKDAHWYKNDEEDSIIVSWRDEKAKKSVIIISTKTESDSEVRNCYKTKYGI